MFRPYRASLTPRRLQVNTEKRGWSTFLGVNGGDGVMSLRVVLKALFLHVECCEGVVDEEGYVAREVHLCQDVPLQ